MKHNDYIKHTIKNEDKLIDLFSLPNAILAPIYALVFIRLHPEMPEIFQWMFRILTAIYIILYLVKTLHLFPKYILNYMYHIAYYFSTDFAVYLAFYYDFTEEYSLTIMMFIYYISLTFEKMNSLLIYLSNSFILIGFSLIWGYFESGNYNRNGLILFICLIIFSVVVIINRFIRNQDAKALQLIAHYDPVTRLPNRSYLDYNLKELLENSKKNNGYAAVMFIDLDRFKKINDTLGHVFGDQVLRQVSQVLRGCLNHNDLIARYGGDEFIVVLEDVSPERIDSTAAGMINSLSTPFRIKEHTIDITASIGISIYPKDAYDPDILIKYADIAMYHSKSQGKNTYRFYMPEMSDEVTRRMQLENGLKRALHNKEFIIYYQPEINFSTESVISAEALIRWNHPTFGLISPNEFIPVAEETGLILPIGEWVLQAACTQNKAWQEAGLPPINIAVNVSSKQLKHNGFIPSIREALKISGLEPRYLEIEITESVLRRSEEIKHVLNDLSQMGIRISIDDFGVGYSSLSMLQHVVINNLKIDMSFIRDIPENPKAAAIVKTIIEMGKNLNCNITAEGVETPEQAEFLKENQCNFGQGYLFSRPLTETDLAEFLKVYQKSGK